MADSGAKVRRIVPPTTIEQFDDLVEALRAMVEASDARISADLARSQTMLEVLATLQAQVRSQKGVNRSPQIDMSPLIPVLEAVAAANRGAGRFAITYEFTFGRSQQGFVSKIRAEPVEIKEL